MIPRDILTNLKWSNEFEVVQTSRTSPIQLRNQSRREREDPFWREEGETGESRFFSSSSFFPTGLHDKHRDSLLEIRNRHASK